MAWNNSRIKSFRRCQRQYAFRYDTVPGKELVPRVSSLPLKRGGWLHELQEAYHRQLVLMEYEAVEFDLPNVDWRARHAELTDKFNNLFDEEKAELGDLPGETLRLFRSYLRYAKRNGDSERYTTATLLDGAGPAIEFVVEVSLDRYGISAPFKGRIDRLVEDREYGGLWIWDAKWVKSLPSPDERMMSPQAVLYVWALRKLGYDVRGFVFNYGRTKAPTIPRVLQRPAGQLSMANKMDTTYDVYLRRIKEVHGDQWKRWVKHVYLPKLRQLNARESMWFRRERIPVEPDRIKRGLTEFLVSIKDIERRNTKHPPRTYEYNCKFQCAYHGPCVAEFNGLDITPLLRQRFITEEERYTDAEIED